MEYKRFTDKIFLRADRGEELVSAIVSVCEKENVRLASVSGIGAAGLIRAGYFDVTEKRYHVSEYRGDLEILSLLGNITEKDGEVYAHLHVCFAKEDGAACGGHLSEAVVSGTGEIVLSLADGRTGRRFDEKVGLNVFSF